MKEEAKLYGMQVGAGMEDLRTIPNQIQRLTHLIDTHGRLCDELNERIQPILAEAEPKDVRDKMRVVIPVPLAECIARLADSLDMRNCIISDMIKRINI